MPLLPHLCDHFAAVQTYHCTDGVTTFCFGARLAISYLHWFA